MWHVCVRCVYLFWVFHFPQEGEKGFSRFGWPCFQWGLCWGTCRRLCAAPFSPDSCTGRDEQWFVPRTVRAQRYYLKEKASQDQIPTQFLEGQLCVFGWSVCMLLNLLRVSLNSVHFLGLGVSAVTTFQGKYIVRIYCDLSTTCLITNGPNLWSFIHPVRLRSWKKLVWPRIFDQSTQMGTHSWYTKSTPGRTGGVHLYWYFPVAPLRTRPCLSLDGHDFNVSDLCVGLLTYNVIPKDLS